jgi:hypothetical protein
MAQYSTSIFPGNRATSSPKPCAGPSPLPQRNKPRLVLLSIEDYRRLTARADTRKAGRLETMPDDVFEDVKRAVGAYEREGDET